MLPQILSVAVWHMAYTVLQAMQLRGYSPTQSDLFADNRAIQGQSIPAVHSTR
jgi:hypothetical protein